jgi:hypothetical protein
LSRRGVRIALISYPGPSTAAKGGRAIELETILAGPVLRRVEAQRVCIWVATSGPAEVVGRIYGIDAGTGAIAQELASATAERRRIGTNLFVHLVEAGPSEGALPLDQLLGYDLELDGRGLGELGLLEGPGRIAYGTLPLPTFFIRGSLPSLRVLHGSCRLLHGTGEDALLGADEYLSRRALDVTERPGALFLTGDQIYADDVAGPLAAHLRVLAPALWGEGEPGSVPGVSSLDDIPLYGRKSLACEQAQFTSDKPVNHLMSFGEFAAMYVMAWNERNWPERFPDDSVAVPAGSASALSVAARRRKYRSEVKDVERARAALPAVRRVLANLACYMCFDDHDTSDDWNITSMWRSRVHGSPAGRRAVSNALASFWAFQGWGNDPQLFSEAFKSTVSGFLSGDEEVEPDAFEAEVLAFDSWSYVAPTTPATIFLDTRTQRSFDDPEGAAHLVGSHGRARIKKLLQSLNLAEDEPVIFVSPVPVCGLELQERRQKFLVKKVGPYHIDFEAWQSSLKGFVEMMECLIIDMGLTRCVFLSGDVHYGLNLRFEFTVDSKKLKIIQLVSSGFKHSGIASRTALYALGHLIRERHERVGWRHPPEFSGGEIKRRLLRRPVNTDDWAQDAPVFLSPRRAEELGVSQEPDYRESRVYVKPEGRSSSVLIGENNVGLVSVEGSKIEHRILGREGDKTVEHIASLDL